MVNCPQTVHTILENATALAWGDQWGCTNTPVTIDVTPYYQIQLETVNLRNLGVEKLYSTPCYIPIIQLDGYVDLACSMTEYGGYRWVVKNRSQCVEPSLQQVTNDTLELIIRSPIKCQLLIFTMFDVLNNYTWGNVTGMKRVRYILNMLNEHCSQLTRHEFEAAFSDITRLVNHLFELSTIDYLQSNDSTTYLMELTNILDLYANYLVHYHGVLAKFSMLESNFFVRQIPRDGRSHESPIEPDFRIDLAEDHATILVTCTRVFRNIDLLHDGYRILHGLCVVRVKSLMHETYKLRFTHAQRTQVLNHRCLWSPMNNVSFEESPEQPHCQLEVRTRGGLACACDEPGIVILIQRGTGNDDMRHTVLNMMGEIIPFGFYLTVACLLCGSAFSQLCIQKSSKVIRKVTGTRKKIRHARTSIHQGTQIQFLCGIKILLLALTARFDDEDNCLSFGFLQIIAFYTYELMNLSQGITLFLLPRTHRPLHLLGQIELGVYILGLVAGLCWYFIKPYEIFNIQCLPQMLWLSLTVPCITVNGVTLTLVLLYMNCFQLECFSQALGVLLSSVFGLAQWCPLFKLVEPGKELNSEIKQMSLLHVGQGIVLFLYHSIVKLQIPILLEKLNKTTTLSFRKWQRQSKVNKCIAARDTSSECEAESKIHGILNGILMRITTTTDSLTSLEYDKPLAASSSKDSSKKEKSVNPE